MPNPDAIDRELDATLHVLSALVPRRRVERHIDRAERAIDFPALLAQPWSSSERAMLEIACTLWGREDIADARLSPLIDTLDDDNFERVIQGIRIRRGGPA